MTAWASDKSEGPYAEHAPQRDAWTVAWDEYTPEPELTPGQEAALLRSANEARARMSPDERARYDAGIADPWATT